MIAPRPELAGILPCPHGSIGGAELGRRGLAPSDVIDFSASTNPLGPSPRVRAALQEVSVGRYPDDGCHALRQALADRAGVPPDAIAVGNGSMELIWLLALAYLRPGDRVAIVGPTFGEYARAARIFGAEPVEIRARADDGFRPPVDEVARTLSVLAPRLVFVCNPNNPTGALLDRPAIRRLLASRSDALLVVDEAYLPFCTDAPDLVDQVAAGQLVLLRSLTKDLGLAGLRLGYVLAAPAIVDALERVRPPWNVNAAAQAAGLAALADHAHLERAREVVASARTYLVRELSRLGLKVYPPAANFVLVGVGDGRRWRERLLRRGLCVRDCASFGLPDCVRIGVRTGPECARLVEGIAREQSGGE